jgi:hypothetical protein
MALISSGPAINGAHGLVSPGGYQRLFAFTGSLGHHPHSRSIVQTAGVIGVGIVFSQTNDHRTNRVYGDPRNGQITTLSRSQICPSFIGGVDTPVRLSNKVALVIQTRAQVTLRRQLFAIDDVIYGRFALIPGIALQIHSNH